MARISSKISSVRARRVADQIAPRHQLSDRDRPSPSGEGKPTPDRLEAIVQPSGWLTEALAPSPRANEIEQVGKTTEQLTEGDIARAVSLHILPGVPPLERTGIFEQTSSLAGVPHLLAGW